MPWQHSSKRTFSYFFFLRSAVSLLIDFHFLVRTLKFKVIPFVICFAGSIICRSFVSSMYMHLARETTFHLGIIPLSVIYFKHLGFLIHWLWVPFFHTLQLSMYFCWDMFCILSKSFLVSCTCIWVMISSLICESQHLS